MEIRKSAERNCINCRWHRLNEDIEDERGKHECYAYSLICFPLCLGYGLESGCDKFEQKKNETDSEIMAQWQRRIFQTDESVKLLVSAMMERERDGS